MKNIIVFASGAGTNFINIYNSIKNGEINGNINLLVSNNYDCGAVKFAQRNKIE